MKGEKEIVKGKTRNGYFLYEDGVSYWGTNMYRFGNVGIEVTEDQHKKLTKEEKLILYKEESEKRDKASKEAAEAKKTEEHKKK